MVRHGDNNDDHVEDYLEVSQDKPRKRHLLPVYKGVGFANFAEGQVATNDGADSSESRT